MNNYLPKPRSALNIVCRRLYGLLHLRYRRASIVVLILIGLLIPVTTACIATNHPLKVGITSGLASDNLYLAEELKYYHGKDVRLIDYPTAADQLRAFRNRQIDVTAVPLSDALILAQTDPELRGFLILSYSQGEDTLIANESIVDLQDLAGKSIGLEASSRSRLLLAQALDQAKLSYQEVQAASIPLAKQIEAFKQGQIAAVATHEPIRSTLLAAGGHGIYPASETESPVFNILLVRGDEIKQQKKRLIALSQGGLKASDYASHHPRETSEHLAKRHHISPELITQAAKTVHSLTLAENQQLLESGDPKLQRQVKLIGKQLQQQQLLNQFVTPTLAWDDGIVRQLKG